MTTTRVYKSTDSSAPVLVGGVSSLIDLLDKCLVTGYGAKTAAGWTKPFTGTNKAAFRNSVAAGGTGMYLRVNDSGSGTGGAREALCRAYLTMSDVDTGTIETPTVAQLAASIVCRKSNTVDSTARAWVLIADERTFYLNIDNGTLGGSGTISCKVFAAGDINSHVAGDAYPFFITGNVTQHGAGNHGYSDGIVAPAGLQAFSAAPSTTAGYIARGHAGSGSPINFGLAVMTHPNSSGVPIGATNSTVMLANPSPGSGLLYFHPAFVCAESSVRGVMRGVYCPLNTHYGSTWQAEIVNPPGFSGTLMTLKHNVNGLFGGANVEGHIFVDISNAWG